MNAAIPSDSTMNGGENSSATQSTYILITAARDEADYIKKTLESVTKQTVPPQCWIIVSDGSTDETDEIVLSFCKENSYIKLLRRDPGQERNFRSKAQAIAAGYNEISNIPHTLVGILDADISFNSHYYKRLIEQFDEDPQLGIAGGGLLDIVNGCLVPQLTSNEWSVSGPVQMFRKECWREIGGYLPIRSGIDAAAEIMARMRGWKVRSFPELNVLHHRPTGLRNHGPIAMFFHRGQQVFQLGYHPLFFLASTIRFFRAQPFVLGGLAMLCGYSWAGLSFKTKMLPADTVSYLRQEQISRLSDLILFRKSEPQ